MLVSGKIRLRVDVRNLVASGENDRPAVFPPHREQKRFSADVVRVALIRPRAKKDGPPVAPGRLHEVRVSSGRDRERIVLSEMALREDRIPGVRREWPGWR